MKKYYGYIRVSTVKQGEGVSLQEQRAAIERYAQNNGLTVASWFEEKETAAKRGRRLFVEMLARLKKGSADGVIIHKIDRSARNLKDWADLGELIDRGIEVHFSHEGLDLKSRGGRLSADIQAVVAADYIRNLREETRKGFYGRLKQGLYPLPAPPGYLDQGRGKPKIPDPETAHLIMKAFELYGTGTFSLHNLRAALIRLGLRNREGGYVSINGLSLILNNPFYAGIIRIKRTGETFAGIHEPLVSVVHFERVRAILLGKTNIRLQKHNFLFRRLLRCLNCNSVLYGETHKGFAYYRCQSRECPIATCVREETVDEAVKAKLTFVVLTDPLLDVFSGKVADLRRASKDTQATALHTIQVQLVRIQTRLDRLTDAYIDRLVEKEAFTERRETLLKEQQVMKEQLAELRENSDVLPNRFEQFLEQAKSVQLSYISGSPEKKRELLEEVISNRLVDRKNVVIELHYPFHEVEKWQKLSHGDPCCGKTRTEVDELFEKLLKYFNSLYEK